MPRIEDIGAISKQDYPIVMLIEKTSDKNTHSRILNLVKNLVDFIQKKENEIVEANIKFAIYTFSDLSTQFNTYELKSSQMLDFDEFFDEQTVDLTRPFLQLKHSLSLDNLLNKDTGYIGYALPTIILVLDGNKRYLGKEALEELNENQVFNYSRKIVLLLNEKNISEDDILCKFAKTNETIFKVDEVADIIPIIVPLFIKPYDIPSGDIMAPERYTSMNSIVHTDPIADYDSESDLENLSGWDSDDWC